MCVLSINQFKMINHIEIFKSLLEKLNKSTKYSEQWSIHKEDKYFFPSETNWVLNFTYYKSEEKHFYIVYHLDLDTKKFYVDYLGKTEEFDLSTHIISEFLPLLDSLYKLYGNLINDLLIKSIDNL